MSDTIVHVSCVRHTYPDRTSVHLCGLDFVVERGQRIVVLGPNGCGKSTLLFHILGLLEPQGFDRRGIFDQQAIAHGLDDPPAGGLYRRIDDVRPRRPQPVQRAFLIPGHQPGKSDHVCGHDGGQAAFHSQILHGRDRSDNEMPVMNVGWPGRVSAPNARSASGGLGCGLHSGHPALASCAVRRSVTPGMLRIFSKS